MPDVQVAVTAFPNNWSRLEAFDECARSHREKITASRHAMGPMIVAAERVEAPFALALERLCRRHGCLLHWHEPPADIGRNSNFLWEMCTCPYVVWTQEDNTFFHHVDISSDIDFLHAHQDCLIVRYVGSHLIRILGEVPGTDLLEVDRGGPWPFTDMAHLRQRERFSARIGPQPEGAAFGMAEARLGSRVARRPDCRVLMRKVQPAFHADVGRILSTQRSRWPEDAVEPALPPRLAWLLDEEASP